MVVMGDESLGEVVAQLFRRSLKQSSFDMMWYFFLDERGNRFCLQNTLLHTSGFGALCYSIYP